VLDWLTPQAYKLEPKMIPQLSLIEITTEPRLIWIEIAKKLLVFLSKYDVSIDWKKNRKKKNKKNTQSMACCE
jgi:hypothetical protein